MGTLHGYPNSAILVSFHACDGGSARWDQTGLESAIFRSPTCRWRPLSAACRYEASLGRLATLPTAARRPGAGVAICKYHRCHGKPSR